MDEKETFQIISEKLFRKVLKYIDWSTCELHKGMITDIVVINEIKEAAKTLKKHGISWEEYT